MAMVGGFAIVGLIYLGCCGIFGAKEVNNGIGRFGLNAISGVCNLFDGENYYSVKYDGELFGDHYVGYINKRTPDGKDYETGWGCEFEGNVLMDTVS